RIVELLQQVVAVQIPAILLVEHGHCIEYVAVVRNIGMLQEIASGHAGGKASAQPADALTNGVGKTADGTLIDRSELSPWIAAKQLVTSVSGQDDGDGFTRQA